MAPHTLLLLAALCVGSAFSLRCYTCNFESSNSKCKTETTCLPSEDTCETSVGKATINGVSSTSITKKCTDFCIAGSSSSGGLSSTVSCCTTDLCNVSGAISIKPSSAAIFLVMGTILVFFSDSLL